jgi:hypothetical protein
MNWLEIKLNYKLYDLCWIVLNCVEMTCWVSWVFIFVDILKAGKMLLVR